MFSSLVLLAAAPLKRRKLKLGKSGPKEPLRKAIKSAEHVFDDTARHAETKFEYIALCAFQGTIYLAMLAFWRDLIWSPVPDMATRLFRTSMDAGVMILGTSLSRWFLRAKEERAAFKRQQDIHNLSLRQALEESRKPIAQEILEAGQILDAVRRVFKDIQVPQIDLEEPEEDGE